MSDFAPRPFSSVEEMNQTIIDHWNEKVSPEDTVYHLGDIALYFVRPERASQQAVLDVLNQLNGHLVLIKGNPHYLSSWSPTTPYLEVDQNLNFTMLEPLSKWIIGSTT